jgi:hypothetical protein
MHSNAALVLWPWGDTSTDSPNVAALTTCGRRIAYFNGYTPQQSNELYYTDGTTVDSMYGLLGVASYTIETNGFDFFEDCATFESDTAPTNLEALRYISRALHAPYRLPAGPDTIDVSASAAQIAAGDPLTITTHLDSSRFNDSNGTEPVHDIAGASAYIDALPWDPSAVAIPLVASDGLFNSPQETAQVSIPTSDLEPGRHFVYVQALSLDVPDRLFANGFDNAIDGRRTGTPNAVFFDVTPWAFERHADLNASRRCTFRTAFRPVDVTSLRWPPKPR